MVGLLGFEANGLAIDFTDITAYNTDPWNQIWNQVRTSNVDVFSSPHTFYTNTGTSPKMVMISPTTLGWSPHNLALQSQALDNAAWSPARCTVAANQTAAPDGTVTAEKVTIDGTTNSHYVQTTAGITVVATSVIYTFSFYLKFLSQQFVSVNVETLSTTIWLNAVADLVNGTITQSSAGSGAALIGSSIQSVGNGWYRVSVTGTLGAQTSAFPEPQFHSSGTPTLGSSGDESYAGNGTSAFYVWGAQANRGVVPTTYIATTTAAVMGLPISYGEGLWSELAATNLTQRSQEFGNVYWDPQSSTITSDALVAPDGTTTADRVVETTAVNGAHGPDKQMTLTSGALFTTSVYAKAGTRNYLNIAVAVSANNFCAAVFDLVNGVIGETATGATSGTIDGTSIQAIGNGWYRCALAGHITGANPFINFETAQFASGNPRNTGGDVFFTAAGGDTLNLWGAQFETGSVATSYIPTVAANVTRAKDVCGALQSQFPNCNAAGTAYVSVLPRDPSPTFVQFFSLEDAGGGATDEVQAFWKTTFVVGSHHSCVVGSASQADIVLSAPTVGVVYQDAFAWAVNNFGASANGGSASTDVAGSISSILTNLTLGHDAGAVQTQGFIRKFIIVPRRLSDGELTTLSSSGTFGVPVVPVHTPSILVQTRMIGY